MAPQSKASKRAGDEITESKPKKPRAPQARKTTITSGKEGRKTKSTAKSTVLVYDSEDDVEVVERPKYVHRKMCRAENCFPRFGNGDVYISLGKQRKYNYQLNGSVLARASTWFERSLSGDRPVEMDEALAQEVTSGSRVEARYELRLADDFSMGYLIRVSLTRIMNPEILPTPAATPTPPSDRGTHVTSQPSTPTIRRATRSAGHIRQLDGHGSGVDEFYHDPGTIILTGTQRTIKAENEEIATNLEPFLHGSQVPIEPVIEKDVAEQEKPEATAAIASQKIDTETALEEEVVKNENVKIEDVKNEDVKNEDVKNEELEAEEVKEEEVKEEEIKEEEIKEEEIKEEEIKEEEIKEEEIKEEEICSEEIKCEDVKDETVKDEAVKNDAVKNEDAKKEEPKREVEDEEVEQDNIRKDDINSVTTFPKPQVDATTALPNLVGKEVGINDIITASKRQAGVTTIQSEPVAEEEADAANVLLSLSLLREAPVRQVATMQATIKHEVSEATMAVIPYQKVQSESSQRDRKEKPMEPEYGVAAVRPRVAQETKTWPVMLKQAKTNKKELAKLTLSNDETAPAEQMVRKPNHLKVPEDLPHLKSHALADTELAQHLNKQGKGMLEESPQNVTTSTSEMERNQTESKFQGVEISDAILNEEPNEVTSPRDVIDLTDSQSTTDQDETMTGDTHAEDQTNVAGHTKLNTKSTTEPGKPHADMERVINEKLAAGQKLSGDTHPIESALSIQQMQPTMEASESLIVSGRKTDIGNYGVESSPIVKEASSKEHNASDPKPPKPTGPSENLLEAYNNLFLIYYSQTPLINSFNIELALKQIELLVEIAGIYGSLPIVRPHVDACLLSFHRELYEAIARDPPRWVKLAILIKSTAIFKEGIIHIVGTFPAWPSTSTRLEELGTKTNMLIEKKISALDNLKNRIDKTLFLTSIRVNGKEVYLEKNNPSTLSTWFVVQLWRDWYTRSLSEAIHRGDQKQNAIATMYRSIARGGDAYLPLGYVVEMWEAFLHTEQSSNAATAEKVAEDLNLLKNFAQQAVLPLCTNNSILEAADIGYFTCTKVEDYEYPWLEALALNDSMMT